MKDILNAYVKAAKAGKSFSEVAGLFEKDSSCKKENKEFYNDLKKQLGSGDGYITKEVNLIIMKEICDQRCNRSGQGNVVL